jgi:signal transduction histidine kinase
VLDSRELSACHGDQAVGQAVRQSVFVLDGDLRIVLSLNRRRFSAEEEPGLKFADYLASCHSDCVGDSVRLTAELAGALSRDSQGSLMWPLRGREQSLNGSHLRLAWHKITPFPERRWILSLGYAQAADRRLAPASQALPAQKAFVNQLVHELRTPLAIASGSLKRAGVHVPESLLIAREHLSVAEQELRRIRRLVDHLSLLTDVETGSKRWMLELHSAGMLLDVWQGHISPDLRQRLVRILARDVRDQCVYVAADALAVVIDNLCDNAMRYSAADSPVVLLLTSGGPQLNLYVADWGSGIPAQQREHVFDPFRRLEEHRDPSRADGSGLGLSVCRSLVEMMHGTICILSDPQALGLDGVPDCPSTVLKVSLPRLSENAIELCGEAGSVEADLATVNPPHVSGLNQQQLQGLQVYLERCGEEAQGWPRSLFC